MGGFTNEFDISLNSGRVVCESLNENNYHAYPCVVTKTEWYNPGDDGKKHPVNPCNLSISLNGRIIKPNLVFNTIHGSPGEDGQIAALCKLQNIPQTSTHFYSAALSFNKRDCLSVLKAHGITCAKSIYCDNGSAPKFNYVKSQLGLPFFVKPNRSGSSFGVSKVKEKSQYEQALTSAFKEDDQILIERGLKGVEVSVGAYSYRGKTIIFSPTEIISDNDFFDLNAKYEGKAQEITPARISDYETSQVKAITEKIYEVLEIKGVCRADFIIENGQAYFIELNTTPGLSRASIIPKQVSHSGLTLTEFFDHLIQETLNTYKTHLT